MQSQVGFSDCLPGVAPAATTPGQLYEVQDTLGVAVDEVALGERVTYKTRGIHHTKELVAAEAWSFGQRLYWHETAKLVTSIPTHWPIGVAAESKPADQGYADIVLDRPYRESGLIVAAFDFEAMPDLGAVGALLLRDFGALHLLTSVELIIPVALAPTTATIGLDDGDATEVLAPAAVNTFDAYQDVTPVDAGPPIEPNVSVSALYLNIGTDPITAGKLIVRAQAVPAA